jgi:phosphoribosylformimino-5-aminoimidazole carboxamide ribotide isomerase
VKFIPAIDLKENKCVRLKQGAEKNITIFNDNPVEQAIFFESQGCDRIHIVDLDAAFGRKKVNRETILKIRKNTKVSIELGGGIKSEEDVLFWINEGVDFVVIGSLAVKKTDLVKNILKKYNNKIYIALDVFDSKIMINGWIDDSYLTIDNILNTYEDTLIKGFILTDISRDGMLKGLDTSLINQTINKTDKNIVVGGGLSNYDDLLKLMKIKSSNLEGVIAGKAFYSGNIKIKKALKICDSHA